MQSWCVKGVPFVNGRYAKWVLFLSKLVVKRARSWIGEKSLRIRLC